jgi:hypothetical protein
MYDLTLFSMVVLTAGSVWSQQISGQDRGRTEDMLRQVAGDVRKHYFDLQFHGLGRFRLCPICASPRFHFGVPDYRSLSR